MSKWHPLHPDRLVLYGIIFTSLNALVKLYWDWYLRRPKQEIIKRNLLIFKCSILDKSGCLSIMLEYRGNPTKSTAIATFPPTVVYLTSSIKRYSSASIVKTAFSSSSGKHWLVPSKHSFVFDSFRRRETLPARHDSNIFKV